MWFLGHGYRAIGSFGHSYAFFKMAHGLKPENAHVVDDYLRACLIVGNANEALSAAGQLLALLPDDAGARSNLALTLLLRGDIEDSLVQVRRALEQAPTDPTVQLLCQTIARVRDGEWAKPHCLLELEKILAHGGSE
jgi:Flp pilus assembly protein TadD